MNVAFIPVRGGSKSIPLKNVRPIAGKPLVYWCAKAANECAYIDVVYIATDSDLIKEIVLQFGFEKVRVIGRSMESASDTATTEMAMLEFANNHDFVNIVLIQATSPLLKKEDLESGFLLYQQENVDSVLSVVKQKRFLWKVDEDKTAVSINYDIFNRPRRQEFDGYFVENGAFYITSKKQLLLSQNRISGNVKAYEMDESTYFEIDEPGDWLIIEKQLLEREKKSEIRRIPEIKMFLTDCDGCLTDGGMYYSEKGDELKKFNTTDGMGLAMLKKKGILTGIVTGENKELNLRRAKKLGLDIYIAGSTNKLEEVKKICKEHGIKLENVAYVGDDLNDLEVIQAVGFGCSVANGATIVKEAAVYVTEKTGGNGAIREIVELILR